MFNKSFKIYLSSYRGFKSKIIPKVIKNKKPIIFIDSLLLSTTNSICTIKVKHKKRFKGESNYKIINLFSLWFDMIENYHFLPIRIGSFVGLSCYLIVNAFRSIYHKPKKIIKIKNNTF